MYPALRSAGDPQRLPGPLGLQRGLQGRVEARDKGNGLGPVTDADLHRGGTGLSVAYRFLCDGEIGIHDERWLTYPWGVLGGETGMRSTKRLVRTDGTMTVAAGGVSSACTGDGNLAINASLTSPVEIAYAPNGGILLSGGSTWLGALIAGGGGGTGRRSHLSFDVVHRHL